MNQKAKRSIAAAVWLLFGLAVLAVPQAAVQGFAEGVRLCLGSLLPTLFPFFVVCRMAAGVSLLCSRAARRFGFQSPRAAAALPLAWLGGYAVCAQQAAALRRTRQIGARDAALLMLLGCCSGPGFVIGSVGGLLLGNVRLGVLLYGLQLAANCLSALVCLPLLPPRGECAPGGGPAAPPPCTLPQAISDAVTSCLQVCGCVVFFRLAGRVVLAFLPPLPWAATVVSAVCEISAGCADFAALGGRAALYGCCACFSLLGISVWAQLRLLLQGTVPLRLLAFSRVVHAVVYALLVYAGVRLLPGAAAVYSTLAGRTIAMRRLPADALVLGWVFLCAALYKLRKSFYNR